VVENMSKSEIEHALYMSRLSLERCNVYLAHLNALLHLLEMQDNTVLGDNAVRLLSGLQRELANSEQSLSCIASV
jgi:hypothetical protein